MFMKALALMPLLMAGTAMAQAPAETRQAVQHCADMKGASFGADVQITNTVFVPAGIPAAPVSNSEPPLKTALPAYCRIDGVINKRVGAGGAKYGIGFSLALPQSWNGRFLLMGGGGLNGSIRPPFGTAAAGATPALARGFAVLSHDRGHKGAVFDNSFMKDQRATLDFSESSVKTVTLLGKAISERFYDKPISKSYMAGCSTGGREGMLASQRYPELFDGIVVGAPAMRTGNSNLGTAYATVMFNQVAPKNEAGMPQLDKLFTTADRALIRKGLLDQCDGLDGLKDGMIENVGQCKFQPAKLMCSGEKAADCLSKDQTDAMERAFAGPKDKAGYALYAPVPYDTGIVATDGGIPGYLPTGVPGPLGKPTQDSSIDLDARINAIRNDAGQRLTDTSYWTNLNTFLDRGGKILFYHGVSDPWFSAWDTWDYWLRAAETNGERWDDASRFYMVPGMGHCRGGDAFDQFDMLDAVVKWVEEDKKPQAIIASKDDPVAATRPLCPFPSYARYKGGDETKAESFVCAEPQE